MYEPESHVLVTLVVDGSDRVTDRDWLAASQARGYIAGLDRVRTVLARLNHPERGLASIHVAGTNGKGTTCAHLANMLWMEGSRVGLFTTPHLCKVEERVRVDGDLITGEVFDIALEQVRAASHSPEPITLSFYEITFLVALVTFQRMEVDWAVFETGLGGRLDPTTLVEAELCIVTSIGRDHEEVLGPTLAHIAMEKASIQRPDIPFVATLPEDDDVRRVIESIVDHDYGYWVHPAWPEAVSFHDLPEHIGLVESMMDLPAVVHYSIEAHRLAAHSLSVLDPELLTFDTINASLLQTHWPGRTPLSEPILLAHAPGVVMFEAAHNVDGMRRACRDLLGHFIVDGSIEEIFFPDVIIFGATQKDDLEGFVEPFLQLLEFLDEPLVILTEPTSGRYPAASARRLQDIFESRFAQCETVIETDPEVAFERAMSIITPIVAEARTVTCEDDVHALVFILGSLYLVGDLLPHVCASSDLELDEHLSILQLRPPNLGMLGE